METVRKWTRRSTQDSCLYSFLKTWKNNEGMDQDLNYFLVEVCKTIEEMEHDVHRCHLLIFLIKVWNQWGNGQEFHRGLLLLFFTKTVHSVWNQQVNGPWVPHRTPAHIPHQKCMETVGKWTRSSTEDSCLYCLLGMYGINGDMDHEMHYPYQSVQNQQGCEPGAPQRTSAYILC